MRTYTKIGASISTAALGAAAALGGAGVAQAQSLGSLGSSDPAPVVLTVAGDTEGVGGTVTNNTDEAVTCGVIVSDAQVISAVEDDFGDDVTLEQAFAANNDALQAANGEGKNAVAGIPVGFEVAAGATEEWTGIGSYGPEVDFRAGAAVECGDEVAFAYESGGLFGSLDMGSLGS